MKEIYRYKRRVAFHETDAMGVAHHTNYIKYFEEARVSWLRDQGLIEMHVPQGPYTFAVVDFNCEYKKPCTFEDEVVVAVQVELQGAKIVFDYAIWLEREKAWIALGRTGLIPVSASLLPAKLPKAIRDRFSQLPRGAEWPPRVE